jgi:hypothetical protein
MRRRYHPVLTIALLLFTAAPLGAQSMRHVIRDLFHFGSCDTLVCLRVDNQHANHFNPDAASSLTTVIDFLGTGISTSINNIPLASTSSGATVAFDASGNPVTSSGSSGPVFGERSQTMGHGRLVFGLNATGASFESIRGVKLNDLRSTLTHENTPPLDVIGDPQFEDDTLSVISNIDASYTAFTAFLSYGLSNTVDVGIAIPVVHFSVSGRSVATIYNTTGVTAHYFSTDGLGNYQLSETASSSGSTTGIGDIALRLKSNLSQSAKGGAALLLDLRLPTGSEENLLGTGEVSLRGLAIFSRRYGGFEPHLNAGYLYRGGDKQNSAVLSTVGFDALLAPGVTFAGEVIGQWQVGANKIALPDPVRYTDGHVVYRSEIPERRDNIVNGALGAKVSLGKGLTLVGNVLFPFTNAGMRSNMVWTVGMEKGR